MGKWSTQEAKRHFNIEQWGEGYVDINLQGHVVVRPCCDERMIDLYQLSQRLNQEGISLPVLVRFKDILGNRINALMNAFTTAIQENNYQGRYDVVYPIKVNQQFSVVNQIAAHQEHQVGLEAGSKSELLTVLGTVTKGARVICNGYKDREYIRLALIGRALGFDVTIVIEKLSELKLILQEADELDIEPVVGVRIRLASIGAGKWQNSGGEKSKFGLTANQVLELVNDLKEAGRLNSLNLMHVHLGSQIANIRDIQKGVREVARYYSELLALDVPIAVIDLGGGLGIDYEGSRSRSYNSINYSQLEYARTIIHIITEACNKEGLKHPDIITESGRALTAHHALLITNVVDSDELTVLEDENPSLEPSSVERELHAALDTIGEKSPVEIYHESNHWFNEAQEHYLHGMINLTKRAHCESLFYKICHRLMSHLQNDISSHRDILDELHEKLADKYFINLSVFQSIPDVWGIDQIFPIIPIHRLDEKPEKHVLLQDLTCDSDGRIDRYVDSESVTTTLTLHALKKSENYLIGVFLVGAYQEILGDMHNLFGDTNAVDVEIDDNGYHIAHFEPGDCVDDMVRYVHFDPEQLTKRLRAAMEFEAIPEEKRTLFDAMITEGMSGYTYFED